MKQNTMNTVYIEDKTSLKDSRYDIRVKVGNKPVTLATCWDSELAKAIRERIESYLNENMKIKI